MPTIRSQQQVYADLLNRYGQLVADAFMRAMEDLRSGAELQRVTAFIQNGDIDGALEALHIDPEAFGDMLDKIREAHGEAGKRAAEALPKRKPDGTALVVRFDGRNPEAERGVAERGAKLVTAITDGARQVATDRMVAGLAKGENPRTVALDLVGRINRATGKREGGILGLTVPQAEFVASAREELASSNPKLLSNYLSRGRRNRTFDRTVRKAILEGKAIDPAVAAKALRAYEQSLLKLRGEMVAKEETFTAMEAGKEQAYIQAVDSGKVAESAVTKRWRHLGNINPRHQHVAINGQTVGLRESFTMPDGTKMRRPHDPEAPARHNLGCHCQADYKIDFYANLR